MNEFTLYSGEFMFRVSVYHKIILCLNLISSKTNCILFQIPFSFDIRSNRNIKTS